MPSAAQASSVAKASYYAEASSDRMADKERLRYLGSLGEEWAGSNLKAVLDLTKPSSTLTTCETPRFDKGQNRSDYVGPHVVERLRVGHC